MAFDPISFLETAVESRSNESVDAMRDLLCETLEASDVSPHVDEAGNVIATRGTGSDGVVLNTHIDTVSPHVPLERDGPIIRGRGACDAKGPLAAILTAFLEADLPGPVTLAVTPDEETASTGAHALVADDSVLADASAVIVGEPTGLDVCTAARGRLEGTITLEGANAHAATPDEGANPIDALAAVLPALESVTDREGVVATHPTLGNASLTATVVRGGDVANQIPATCAVTFDRRSVPPETAEGFLDALQSHLEAAVPSDIDVSVTPADRPTPFLEAWATGEDPPIVDSLASASGGSIRPFGAATEAAYFADLAPTVVFGPGVLADDEGAVAHGPREYVEVDAVRAAAEALTATLESTLEQ